jgi:hypothetical protein
MLIFAISLCAVVAVTYLIQFQAYSHYHTMDLGADLSEIIGLPIENILEFELAVDDKQLSVVN